MILNRIGTRYPEVRAERASKDGPRALLILRGAQERAPQDDAIGCDSAASTETNHAQAPENAASIALRVLMVSLLASTSTSLQRTTAPWATLFFSLTRWA